jgi:DNA repair protein RecO (recombination protein O)
MDWQDEAIVLGHRRHGESSAIVSLLTRHHGRYRGVARGAFGKSGRGVYLAGNLVMARWRARLADHLGNLHCELIEGHAARLMEDAGRLDALAAACALCEAVLPERQPHPATYGALSALLAALESDPWPSVYVHWELALLRDLGYGLDLGTCAATGTNDDLAFVSPKSGRAVSRAAGEPYRDRLLALPAFLVAGGEGNRDQIRDGLRLTAHFIERHGLIVERGPLPAVRLRLARRFDPDGVG